MKGFEQGELIQVNWRDILLHSEICEHVRAETAVSRSVGWFDEFYGDTFVITKEVRGAEVDKQAFPIGCIVSIFKLSGPYEQ